MSETEGRKEDEEPMASDAGPTSGGASGSDPKRAGEAKRSEDPQRSDVAASEAGDGDVELDEVDVRDLLRAALEPPAPKTKEEAALLKGVQRRLRVRSRGKFYSDGWSTSKSPRSTYLLTSIFMLVLIAFVFLVLIPWSGGALP
jgi:hypothetical protein